VLVVVVAVLGMAVAVVKIVHVVAVLDCFVGAVASAVRVLGEGVFCLGFLGHDGSLGRQSGGLAALVRFPAVGDGVTDDVGALNISAVRIRVCSSASIKT